MVQVVELCGIKLAPRQAAEEADGQAWVPSAHIHTTSLRDEKQSGGGASMRRQHTRCVPRVGWTAERGERVGLESGHSLRNVWQCCDVIAVRGGEPSDQGGVDRLRVARKVASHVRAGAAPNGE